jgi:iron complex outermembrane receptor protein
MSMHRASLRVLVLSVLVAGAAFPASAAAQVDSVAARADSLAALLDSLLADSTVFRIEGIEIQSQRPVTTIGGASAVEVDVAALGLPPAPTAAELLDEISGIHVRVNSRGQAEISLRGSESRQVAVLLDGVPLTLGYDARTDVSTLPAGALSEVSFVRGMSTLLHGPNVLGGVVEMGVARTPRFPTKRSVEFSASVDHVGGYATSASGTAPFATGGGQGMLRGGVGFRDSPGTPLASGVSEPVPTGDELRLNTDFSNLDGFLAARYASHGGAWASLSATSHRADRGIAAELGAEQPRLWRYPEIRRTIVALSGGTGDRETPLGRGDLEASVGYDVGAVGIRSYTTRAYDVLAGSEDGDDSTLTLRLLGDHTLGPRVDFRSSFTYADIRHDETVDGAFRAFEQELVSAAAETVWRLVDRPGAGLSSLRLSFGGAYDRGATPLTGGLESLPAIHDWGARAGLSALVADGGTMLHVSASRRGRFPALREVYSEALDRFEPNPGLRPEHLVAAELGITTRLGTGEIQVVGFQQQLTDAIRRISVLNGRHQRVNSEELASRGVEVLFSQTFGRVDVGGEITLQSVELTDPATLVNTEPENVPERSGSAYLGLPVVAGLSTTLEAEYTGSQFCIDPDSGQDVRLDGGSWFNATISKVWPWRGGAGTGRSVETSVSASNLTDTALYDACGLPRAGRLLRLQLRVF